MRDIANQFARRIFFVASVYGLATLIPMYFAEGIIGREAPPPITHSEFFYGFLGTAVAWQALFVLISRDPVRLRSAMLPAVAEKVGYGGAATILWLSGSLRVSGLVFGLIDLLFAVLFAIAWVRTPDSPPTSRKK